MVGERNRISVHDRLREDEEREYDHRLESQEPISETRRQGNQPHTRGREEKDHIRERTRWIMADPGGNITRHQNTVESAAAAAQRLAMATS